MHFFSHSLMKERKIVKNFPFYALSLLEASSIEQEKRVKDPIIVRAERFMAQEERRTRKKRQQQQQHNIPLPSISDNKKQ